MKYILKFFGFAVQDLNLVVYDRKLELVLYEEFIVFKIKSEEIRFQKLHDPKHNFELRSFVNLVVDIYIFNKRTRTFAPIVTEKSLLNNINYKIVFTWDTS